jgi:toxin ParE1/3/4
MKVRWTAPALGDLEAAGDYIARDNPSAAARVITAVLDQADALATHPHIGRPGRVPGTRELVVTTTPFIAAYRVRDQEVEVLAVFHGARRWPDRFSGS